MTVQSCFPFLLLGQFLYLLLRNLIEVIQRGKLLETGWKTPRQLLVDGLCTDYLIWLLLRSNIAFISDEDSLNHGVFYQWLLCTGFDFDARHNRSFT